MLVFGLLCVLGSGAALVTEPGKPVLRIFDKDDWPASPGDGIREYLEAEREKDPARKALLRTAMEEKRTALDADERWWRIKWILLPLGLLILGSVAALVGLRGVVVSFLDTERRERSR